MDSPGVGPLKIERLMHDRSLRLATGLAVAVAIPVAILFYFQFRSISALSQTSALVLRQLSQATSEGVTEVLVDALRTVRVDVLLKIGQRQTEPLDLPFIENTFEQGLIADPFVDRFYVWSDVTTDHRGDVLAFDRTHHEFIVNPPEGTLLVKQFHALAPEQRAIAIFDGTIGDRRTHFQGQLRFTFTRDRLTSFVALAVDAERLRRDFVPKLVASKFANVEGPTGFPSLAVSVLDGTNHVVYPPGGSATDRYVDERTFPLVFFEPELATFAAPEKGRPETWRVRTGYDNQTIPQIITARERPQHAMMAMLAGVMALGVFFVARAAAREVRLAELKSNFVSSVSHDLKTPLALIQLFAETLELGRLKNTDRAQEYYRIINSEARKLTRLINNLLFFEDRSGTPAIPARTARPGRRDPARGRFARESIPAQSVHRDPAHAGPAGDRHAGSGSGGAGAREPPLECDEVFARAPRYRRGGDVRRALRRGARARSRRRHPAAAAAAHLSEVLPNPDRCGHGSARHRARPRHRRPCDAGARRLRPGRQRAGPWQYVCPAFPASRRRDPPWRNEFW
ncbi:MAG: hypothetical protein DMF97_01740 [Acidobacteria bacterium]|nr:MAG: hypothetical protein DMF97_01740 [Acidobacteriota bacterium]